MTPARKVFEALAFGALLSCVILYSFALSGAEKVRACWPAFVIAIYTGAVLGYAGWLVLES